MNAARRWLEVRRVATASIRRWTRCAGAFESSASRFPFRSYVANARTGFRRYRRRAACSIAGDVGTPGKVSLDTVGTLFRIAHARFHHRGELGGGDVVPGGGRHGSKGSGADVKVRGETIERRGFTHALGQSFGRKRRVAVFVHGVQGEGLEGDAEREGVGGRGGVRRGEVAFESKMDPRYRHLEVAEDGVEHARQPSVA